ncbi:MAG: hypothetical protein WBW62_09645 [Solirubrobacterales bacterium]
MSEPPDEPTGVMPDDDEDPTSRLEGKDEPETERLDTQPESSGDESPTGHLTGGSEDPNDQFESARVASTEELRTRRLAAGDSPADSPMEATTEVRPVRDDSRTLGIWVLAVSIAVAVALVGVYIAAGGLDYKPAAAADPCDARPWSDPGNLEETAQQFALSAVDGAACELGVSREELTRALADDQSRAEFAEEYDLSDSQIEEALRSGLNRAIDDAENAGAINGLVAAGAKAAVRYLPMDQLIPLIEDASGLLSGDNVDDIGGILGGVLDAFGGGGDDGGSGSTGDSGSLGDQLQDAIPDLSDDLPGDITQGLKDQLPEDIRENLPDGVESRIQEELDQLLNP